VTESAQPEGGGFLGQPIVTSVLIRAPIEDVWALVADLPAQPKWMTDALEVRVEGDSPYGVGTRAVVPTRIAGITVEDTIEVTRWEPPTLLGVGHVGKLFSGEAFISLEPAGAGTRLAWQEVLRPPLGPVGGLGFWFGRPLVRRQFTRDLERLKALVESRGR
jgi:uncharacterized membrane protein